METTRKVISREDDVSLVSQLKSLIGNVESGKNDNLLSQLKQLVAGFTSTTNPIQNNGGFG